MMPNRKLRTRQITAMGGKTLSWYTNQQSLNLSIANRGKWCDVTLYSEEVEELIAELSAALSELQEREDANG